MKNILVLGAGRSSSTLIEYLLKTSEVEGWNLVIADQDVQNIQALVEGKSFATALQAHLGTEQERKSLVSKADVVISLLPALMHPLVAKDCLESDCHLITASYVSEEMKLMADDVKRKGLLFLNEMGLDPGVDHMSAMEVIDRIHEEGGELTSFKSYCGGLVAPESNDNPWGYKFTWNPRNVILAGQGTAKYRENGKYRYVPYNRIFTNPDQLKISENIVLEGYPNRDSLSYQKPYRLEDIRTILRGTLRYPKYIEAWNILVKLGLTDDSYKLDHNYSYAELMDAFLPLGSGSLKSRLALFSGIDTNSPIIEMIEWTGIFSDEKIGDAVSPAQALQSLLERKWKLNPKDVDMVVMQHLFEYKKASGQVEKLKSTLVVKGTDQVHTAMAKTVGLPAAIACKLLMNGSIRIRGVRIPVIKEIYEPVLKELAECGITFNEEVYS